MGFSTDRLLTSEKPETFSDSQNLLFLQKGENRQGEGGLRTQGFYKKSYNEKPLISIITVVYNGEKFLEETILSTLNQSYDNVEYIIIDGGSTDGTLDIIRKYENVVDYWVSEKDFGIYDAMNKGINVATGDWINFMNAGDKLFDINTIKNIIPSLNVDLIYGNHALYKEQSNEYNIVDVSTYSDKRNIPFCHQSLFVKAKLLKKNLFNIKYKIAADYDQYLRLKNLDTKILYLPMTISLYLDGGLSSTSRKKLIYEYYAVTRKYTPIYSFFVFLIRVIKFQIFGR